ncbi:enoyl-CoA hydratase/isomerase family protein [Pseudomonas sp. OIL-1]|uniref:enoyl-CoA hydratase/isomerase family protein n=1 Tax=Pseudomonas sp. OIL-1 TaxID=2706126 RepID=UPI001C49B8CB|nr:enoyl-CoA hydratase-related protein [Pseudomonas sp. OIL-1]
MTQRESIMPSSPLKTERNGALLHLRFNRPGSLNAIDSAMASVFQQSVEQAVADPYIRVIVLSGEGRSFMAGGDIAQFAADPDSIPDSLIEPMNQAIELLSSCDKIVLGSVQGPIAGAGMSLALACDLLIAADTTRFSFAYTALGVSGDLGITWTLPRQLGLRRAMSVALLGETIKAEEALALDLVNQLVPADHLEDRTEELGQRLCRLPALAAGNIKRLLRSGLEQDLVSQLAAEKQAFSQCIAHPDFNDAVQGFLTKRN